MKTDKMWKDVLVEEKAGYYTSVTNYHSHDYYEINLILSGNVKIYLGNTMEETDGNRLIITRPGTKHYILCRPNTLYKRLYIMFEESFVADRLPEWELLSSSFGEKGRCIPLDGEQVNLFWGLIKNIGNESNSFRQMLLIYNLLSHVSELSDSDIMEQKVAPYVIDVFRYVRDHYGESITIESIAESLHMGRTALAMGFKEYTGSTVHEYITSTRLKNAIRLLVSGEKLEYTARKCGFSDASGLIRCFKRNLGMTPKQYLNESRRI